MLQRQAARTVIKIGGQVVKDFHVLSADLSTGGARLDTAVLEFVGGRILELEDEVLTDFSHKVCEISVFTLGMGTPFSGGVSAAPHAYEVVHFGMIAAQTVAIDASGAKRGFVSRLEPFFFGQPLIGMRVRATPKSLDAEDDSKKVDGNKKNDGDEKKPPKTVLLPEDIVFNGEYHGRCLGNKSKGADIRQVVFIPPEQLKISSLTGATSGSEKNKALDAKTADGLEAEFWTLSTAVLMLCDCCNSDEGWIKNPTLAELKAAMGTDDKVLRNHKQPLGKYLPSSWTYCCGRTASTGASITAADVAEIRVFARGRGEPGRSSCSRSASSSTCGESNAEALDLTADVSSRCVNQFRCWGITSRSRRRLSSCRPGPRIRTRATSRT
jgi:hypothetical protein